ncbi:inhibin beta C chain-like [Geospiza fortis]|uniref:Inhibin beta C chain-like n=1 Tax=Geospiza fortis TaxID=48883 RepID=A0A8N5EZW5_GEOFO|nr:inhibin beta C chain-like [Geospiza fortis]
MARLRPAGVAPPTRGREFGSAPSGGPRPTYAGPAAPLCPGGSGGARGRLSHPGSANICGHVRRTSPVLPAQPSSTPLLLSLLPFCLSDAAGSPSRCHLPPPGMSLTVVLLLLSLPRVAAAKGGWCPACGVASLAPGAQRDALLALAKQSILGLLTPSAGSSTSHKVQFHFRFSQEVARSTEVQQATLYLFWTSLGTHPVTIRLLQPDPAGPNLTVTSETRLEVQGPGWTTLDVGAAVQNLFTQDTPRLTVHLELPEGWESPLPSHHGDSHRPFVVAKARSRTPHRVRRRGVDCGADSRMCCRREFFVDFKEIGWEDWIIQPEGYHMNYCSGLCPLHMAGIPGLAASFHTAVLNRIKAASGL